MSDVPCNGCKRCCQDKQAILVSEEYGDDVSLYQTQDEINPLDGNAMKILAWKDNGDCIYLGESGCTIYDQRPTICRTYDCRMQYMSLTRALRDIMVREKIADYDIFLEGKKRVGSLTGEERLKAIQLRKIKEAA